MTKSPYEVRVDARVAHELHRVPAKDAERIIKTIEALGNTPYPRNVKKLVQQPGWRVRIGKYRILYEVDDDR